MRHPWTAAELALKLGNYTLTRVSSAATMTASMELKVEACTSKRLPNLSARRSHLARTSTSAMLVKSATCATPTMRRAILQPAKPNASRKTP